MEPIRTESTHFMVLPAPKFWNSPSNNNFQISFSGIAVIEDFKGNADGSWRNDILNISEEFMRMDKIMERVIDVLPQLSANQEYHFVPLQWASYGTINSEIDEGSSVDAGFGAYNFGIVRNSAIADENTNQQVRTLNGMYVNIQARDRDARIYRVGYSITLYGYFASVAKIIIGKKAA